MDAATLLSPAVAPLDRLINVAQAALSRHHPDTECPGYFAALRYALAEEPSPFATDAYAEI